MFYNSDIGFILIKKGGNKMPTLNRIQLIGRLGKDPESRQTSTGKQVTSFSLAVSQHWKSNGEAREATEWINIEAWGRLAEICQEYLNKGSLVYIEGRLKTDRYEEKGGTKFFTKVVASSMQMLDKKSADQSGANVEEVPIEYETE
jgi:single-strand DNA-binding protein